MGLRQDLGSLLADVARLEAGNLIICAVFFSGPAFIAWAADETKIYQLVEKLVTTLSFEIITQDRF